MSKFKIEFMLKQHTPIIHFQSDQSGATLRATELKPKFDRFIIKKLKNINFDIYNRYKDTIEDEKIFPKNGVGSHCYKIFINNTVQNEIGIPKANVNPKKETDRTAYQAPYFADASKSAYTSREIKVTIQTFYPEVLKLLDEVKDYIFIYENFGTRQSKGFGSFLRADITKNDIDKILKKYPNKAFTLGKTKDYKSAFLKVDNFYKKLKMGINKPYYKSLLFKYMCSKYNIGWEKKFIKEEFPEVIHGEHKPATCDVSRNVEYRYIRAVLGLAEHNEFRPPEGKKQVKIKSKENIERFKSPLTFKIFNNNIYLIYDDSYKQILDKEFIFKLSNNSKAIKTPSQFDMYDFLKFVQKQENYFKEVM